MKRLLKLNRPEFKYGIVGVFASACFGLQTPGMASWIIIVAHLFAKQESNSSL